MALQTTRRSLITGLIAFAAAPAIVRAANLMPVKVMPVHRTMIEEIVWKSLGDNIGPFRRVVIYDQYAGDQVPLRRIDLDYPVSLFNGETMTVSFPEPVEGPLAIRME